MRYSKPVIFIETGGKTDEQIAKEMHEAGVKLYEAIQKMLGDEKSKHLAKKEVDTSGDSSPI